MEQWKHIEINPDWEVSNKGDIRLNGVKKKPLKLGKNTYIQQAYFVNGKPKTIKVRFIVYLMFIGQVDETKYHIKHKDGDIFNCSADNLYLEIKKSYLRRIELTSKRWIRRKLLYNGIKKCSLCYDHKTISEFYWHSTLNKCMSFCKKCQNDKSKNQMAKRLKNDSFFRLRFNLRQRTTLAIKSKGYTKESKTKKMLGCEWEFLKEYLENQFQKGMNWDNYGEWHVDHIIPISMAKTEEQLYKLSHYSNLQPLWANDNLNKKDFLPKDKIEKAKEIGLEIDYTKII